MNLRIKRSTLSKRSYRPLFLVVLFFVSFGTSSLANTRPSTNLKASVSYNLAKDQKFKIRVTQIPKKYPWVERDIEGYVKASPEGSLIIAENLEDIFINDTQGEVKLIPVGSKFYARVKNVKENEHFMKDANTVLEFFGVEVNNKKIRLSKDFYLNSNQKNEFKSKASKVAKLGLYSIGGALAGPMVAYSLVNNISFLGSMTLGTNPYVLAGSAGLGATVGLAYGILSKGDHNKLEPGLELDLTSQESWFFQLVDRLPEALESEKITEIKEKELAEIKIHKIKKSRNIFGDKSLLVDLTYKNFSNEVLRYSNFKLIDSMGREYEAHVNYDSEGLIEALPLESRLKLYFPVEFPKTKHTLKIVRTYDQKTLASKEFFLKE
jgi:hypothetical protein